MNAVRGRRTFVREIAVGFPVLVGAAAPAAAGGRVALAPFPGASERLDRELDTVLRRMAALHEDMRRRLPRLEDAQTLAAEVLALVNYRRGTNRETEVQAAWRDVIDRHGADRLAVLQPDLTLAHAALNRYGIVHPLHLAAPAAELRARALDDVGRRGFNGFYDQLAEFLQLSLLGTGSAECETLRQMIQMLEVMVGVTCLMAPFLPVLIPECFAASVVLTILQFFAMLMGC